MPNLRPFALEKRMAAKTVNLDALIPRDDFASEATKGGGNSRGTIGISDLDRNGFFQNSLRKPDFQRETTHWEPSAVVDLIKAFLDGDLIPAVILWMRGNEVFVIDGAHRLSALIAWVRDDFGDGDASNAMFGSGLTDEQRNIAERTRKLVKNEIGSYAEFKGLLGQSVADPTKAKRLSAIGNGAIIIQWVTAATVAAAEASFFKINQAAQPIDPVERRILQSRTAPNAIASRCIARGGRGHKYWASFDSVIQERIEALGSEIYEVLYKPPLSEPVTTADVPIAGKGYNVLPFLFNLVNLVNGLKIPNDLRNKTIENPLPTDVDGQKTVEFLKNVKTSLQMVSTNSPGSLGFHPLIYYYARSGAFLSNAFLASLAFAKKLNDEKRKGDFVKVRKRFEDYIHANKIFVSLTISRLGSGARSLERLTTLYWYIFESMVAGESDEKLFESLVATKDFIHLKQADTPSHSFDASPSKRGASKETKSASYIREAMANPLRCHICGGAIHRNSITFDHLVRREDGGDNRSDNLRPAHPYCNSGVKG